MWPGLGVKLKKRGKEEEEEEEEESVYILILCWSAWCTLDEIIKQSKTGETGISLVCRKKGEMSRLLLVQRLTFTQIIARATRYFIPNIRAALSSPQNLNCDPDSKITWLKFSQQVQISARCLKPQSLRCKISNSHYEWLEPGSHVMTCPLGQVEFVTSLLAITGGSVMGLAYHLPRCYQKLG